MFSITNKNCNQALDKIIASRRSIRKFKPEIPPKGLTEQVIKSGLLAPFSGLAVSRSDFPALHTFIRQA